MAYWEEGKRNPLFKVDIGKKAYRNARQILSWEQTGEVLSRLGDPNRLVVEMCIGTSARIVHQDTGSPSLRFSENSQSSTSFESMSASLRGAQVLE